MQPTPRPDAAELPDRVTSTQAERRKVELRLRRAHGQLAAVITALEEGRPCREIITQLAAVSSALDRAGVIHLSNTLQDCLSKPAGRQSAEELTPAEFEKLLLMLT